MSEPLVIVGNGMAAARLVDELTRCALARHAIAVIGDEPRLAYNRMLLSSVLAGETAPEAIELKPMSWWRDSPLKHRERHRSNFLPTFSAPHRRGDRIAWLLPVMAPSVLGVMSHLSPQNAVKRTWIRPRSAIDL